jgi:hypothetical protein
LKKLLAVCNLTLEGSTAVNEMKIPPDKTTELSSDAALFPYKSKQKNLTCIDTKTHEPNGEKGERGRHISAVRKTGLKKRRCPAVT